MSTLERAIAIAVEAHAGQKDKAGDPYILHPLRVMFSVSDDTETRIVAVLHDVVEDNPDWSLERLDSEGFSAAVVRSVDAMTRRPDEDYMAFVARAGDDPVARSVKIADLRDNLDQTRFKRELTAADLKRIQKYERALAALEVAG